MKELVLVVAMTPARVIGKDGALPWHLPEDMKHFRRVTKGHAVVMGRKTWESLGGPLKHRRNIVVTRRRDYQAEGAEVAHTLDDALALAWEHDDEPRVIGGGAIYAEALPRATRIELTEVHRDVAGDAFFPEIDRDGWRESARRAGETAGVEFVTLVRTSAARG